MNIKQIRELAEIIKDSGLSVIEISEGDTTIRMESTPAGIIHVQPEQPPQAAPSAPAAQASAEVVNFNDITEIKAPMVGVFYTAPSPDSEPFVKIGSRIKKGDTLCIIEAMKLMNEITAEEDGEIVDICISNGDIVEYGQTIFKLF
jgi:acetyl-CoA carboxylase biotin carboxyl carrier protein